MEELARLLKEARGYVMSPAERRCQGISWVYGQLALTSEYDDATEDDLWNLRIAAAKAYNERHP